MSLDHEVAVKLSSRAAVLSEDLTGRVSVSKLTHVNLLSELPNKAAGLPKVGNPG